MGNPQMLNESLRDLQVQYLAGRLSLNALVHQCEAFLQQFESFLPPNKHQLAANCVYLLEDINALVLDEARSIRDDERLTVESELQKFLTIIKET
jgi:hypothetical protein